MPDLAALIPTDDPRLDILNERSISEDGECVLLWVQRAQRATGNLAANLAIKIANRLDVPVIAVFCLVPSFPRATYRAYHFMAEGLAELPDAFAKRQIGWALRIGEPDEVIPQLAGELGAAVVVTDLNPLRIGHEWRAAVAERLSVPLVTVDTDAVIPTSLFPKEEWAPRTIRPKILRVLDDYLQPIPHPKAKRTSDHRSGLDPLACVDELDLDRSVAPSPTLRGGPTVARRRLSDFIAKSLARYDTLRDRSDLDKTSRLSPYLHYGQIGPIEVMLAARKAHVDGQIGAEAMDSFINEIVTQRELAINFTLRNPNYDRYEGLPDWGRKTLNEHRNDPRDAIYTLDELASGSTHDRLWNAAMGQMVDEGFMPNRLRMYWAKQIVRWTATPEDAFTTLLELNDRYFLDGRDANSYAGIAWTVGGRHDRPFPPNKPIFGLVRPMGLGALKRRFDPEDYIAGRERPDGERTA